MKEITKNQLMFLLLQESEEKSIVLRTQTRPQQNKETPYKGAIKYETLECTINPKVSIPAQPRRWGHRIRSSPLVMHNQKYYIEVRADKVRESRCLWGELEVDVTPWLYAKYDIGIRDFAFESIIEIEINETVYHLVG